MFRTAAGGVVAGAVSAVVAYSAAAADTSTALYADGSIVGTLRTSTLTVHAAPGSPRVLAMLRPRTPFGTPTTVAVVDIRGDWAEVISTELANGAHGFVRAGLLRPSRVPYALELDRSRRLLVVWRDGEAVRRLRVAVGAPLSPTPIGRFAVTDRLRGFNPAAYGCCILALSGHQTRPAPDWTGGDRLAIHARSSGVGDAVSDGCLGASEADMHWLMARIPVGTQIVIHP